MAGNGKGKIVFIVVVLAGVCAPGLAQTHSADVNGDFVISLGELLRVIQFYNLEGFHCEAGTEDGYAPGPGDQICDPHDSDFTQQYWQISLTELLRLIQFFRSDGYHLEPGTEDGFAPNSPTSEIFVLPGDVLLEMMWIPGGTFMMGRYSGEQDSYSDEDPQHSVTVPGFWMGMYELTKAQWMALMGTTPWVGQSDVLDDPNSPAVYVSWDDAQSFIRALNWYIIYLTFRLPSEAEWEYACRAGTMTRSYWGDDLENTVINDYAWWRDNAGDVGEDYAHIVGLKLPNLFGLYDMSGNVWEWCEDDKHYGYTGAPSDGTAWVHSPRSVFRVLRSGSFYSYESYCRSALRSGHNSVFGARNIGFRVVRTP